MAGPTANQQAKPRIPAESMLVTIQWRMTTVDFCQSSAQSHFHTAKFKYFSYVNSMTHWVMEFFVRPVPALVNIPTRDQVPASGDAEIDPFHVVTW